MWMKACDRAKLPRADRGYALFRRQKNIKNDNVGKKLVTAAQLGTIDIFSDDAVGQILEVLDKRWKTFIRLKRDDEEDIDQNFDKFEECYAGLMKVGRNINNESLAFWLMESVGLRDKLSQLVITGIDEE